MCEKGQLCEAHGQCYHTTDFQNDMHYNNISILGLTIIFQYLQNPEECVIIVSQELQYLISFKSNIICFFCSHLPRRYFYSKGDLTLKVKWEFITKVTLQLEVVRRIELVSSDVLYVLIETHSPSVWSNVTALNTKHS